MLNTTLEYYQATEKNRIILFGGKWVKLEIIMLSKISQIQKDNVTCFLSYVESKYTYIYIYLYILYVY
jgi:hypothetical protein